MREVAPKSLILDILRVTPRPIPVKDLVAVGSLFGLEGNAVRVALTRLGQRELVTGADGCYRLAPSTSVMSQLVDAWRLGDQRVRAWNGAWLCVHHPRGAERSARRLSRRALTRRGFRQGRPELWVRPDNLCASRAELERDLRELGMDQDAALFIGRDFDAAVTEPWMNTLWDRASLERSYADALAELEESRQELPTLPAHAALVQSFLVGGHAIRVLATDPLLPDAICDGAGRRALGEAMISYDRLGKSLWNRFLGADAVEGAPSHIAI